MKLKFVAVALALLGSSIATPSRAVEWGKDGQTRAEILMALYVFVEGEHGCPNMSADTKAISAAIMANGQDISSLAKEPHHARVQERLDFYHSDIRQACDVIQHAFGPKGFLVPDLVRTQ